MRNFVLLRRFPNREGAITLATLLMQRLDGSTPSYSLGWSWMPTNKHINGEVVTGPTLLVCGKCDVLAIRQGLPPDGGSDIYCDPLLKTWIEYGMENDPPPPVEPADGGIVLTGNNPGAVLSAIRAYERKHT